MDWVDLRPAGFRALQFQRGSMTLDGQSIRRTTRSTSGSSSHAWMRQTRSPTLQAAEPAADYEVDAASVVVTDAAGQACWRCRGARSFRQWASEASAKWYRSATSRTSTARSTRFRGWRRRRSRIIER